MAVAVAVADHPGLQGQLQGHQISQILEVVAVAVGTAVVVAAAVSAAAAMILISDIYNWHASPAGERLRNADFIESRLALRIGETNFSET